MSRVGIVTVTFNSAQVINGFLRSVLNQTYRDFVLYVVDNASSDATLSMVEAVSREPRVQVISNPDNRGIAEGNNQGIRDAITAGCKYVLLMNNDTEFRSDLIEILIREVEKYGADMAAPKILYYNEPQKIWAAGGGLDRRRVYSGFHYGYGQVDKGQFDTPRLVDHAPACCLLIRNDVFDKVGLMDPSYFAYVEDTDFSYRAKQAGLKLMYIPSATLLHKAHSLTGGLFSHFMMRYTTRNRVFFMLKHFGWRRGLYYIPAYQANMLLQSVLGKVPASLLWIRQKALLEGVALWHRSTHGRT